MSMPDGQALINGLTLLIVVAVGWVVARSVLRLTARLARIGCLALIVVSAIGWVVYRLA
jgi:hypothetical protein